VRLHELAKELGADSKRLLEIANELGLGIKSHSSKVPQGTDGILKAAWAEELEELAEKEPPAPEPEEAESATVTVSVGDDEPEPAAEPEEPQAAPADEPEPAAAPLAGEPPAEPVEQAEATGDEEAAAAPADAEEEPADAESDAEGDEQPEAAAEDETPAEGPPAQPTEIVVSAGGHRVGHGADRPDEDEDDKDVVVRGVENKPTSRPRKGAKILGRIDLKPRDLGRHAQPETAEPAGAEPVGGGAGTGGGRHSGRRSRPAAYDEPRTKTGSRSGKPDKAEFVFDAEDTLAVNALRIGHVNMRRRTPHRRPMMRRPIVGGGRKKKGPVAKATHPVTVRPPIGVRELSEMMGTKAREILRHFPDTFDPRDKNAVLQLEHLEELALKMEDREITILPPETEEDRLMAREQARREEAATEPKPRAPIVTVMGHVDHGKTTLLDALRSSRVASREAGGITQRTSAYLVRTEDGQPVTFLDTPGHRAFTEMRARGALLTDVAVLVVAADDGVMPQTEEALDHANAAGVPIVVVVNKIDKNNAQPERVKQQLASKGVMLEGWGGDVGVVETSATTGAGLKELIERLALETELLELRADPGVPASGVVVDSTKDPKLGIVVTAIVEEGTLRAKDAVLAGSVVGRVRYMLDDMGKRLKEAGPSVPVQIVGMEDTPEPGARFLVVEDVNAARTVAAERRTEASEAPEPAVDAVTLENLFDTIEARAVQEINVLVKADAFGSVEVLRSAIEEVAHPEVRYKVVRAAVGPVTEDDVLLAQATGAFIIGFGVVPDPRARRAMQQHGIEFRPYDVIYEMTEDLERALEGELAPEKVEEVTGHVQIREIFKVSRVGNIAGCYVTDGTIHRDSNVRLLRDGELVWTGRLDSLKRFKDDVREVREGYECGLHLANYNDIRIDDVLEAFTVKEVKRTLSASTSGPEDAS